MHLTTWRHIPEDSTLDWKTEFLTLQKMIVIVGSEKHLKPIDVLCGQSAVRLTVEACGMVYV
jgi:hypothetical protein